jgi:hypothetical protein
MRSNLLPAPRSAERRIRFDPHHSEVIRDPAEGWPERTIQKAL